MHDTFEEEERDLSTPGIQQADIAGLWDLRWGNTSDAWRS